MRKNFINQIILSGVVIITICTIGSCAKTKVVDTPPIDTMPQSPRSPTAVIESEFKSTGIKGMLASESSNVHYIREQMSNSTEKMKYTGTVMKHLMKEQKTSTIIRIDKNLIWELDHNKKRYSECSLIGCGSMPGQSTSADLEAPEEEASTAEQQEEAACKLKIVKNEFNVEETGQHRIINDFDTHEYKVSWEIVAEDEQQRQVTHLFTVNTWTTPATEEIQKVSNLQYSFTKALLTKINQPVSEMDRLFNSKALAVIKTFFFDTLPAEQRDAVVKTGQEWEKIKGYPIYTKLEWYATGDVCGRSEQPQEEQKLDLDSGVSGLLSTLAGKMVKKKMDEAMEKSKAKPIFSTVQEVKSIRMEMVPDSIMTVPANYKLEPRE